ncbi:hypothetical protein [uncultured Bacteroides sp.]|uniref:hypothetical protein n=1 Tax=uncultured Bacteroides sp. TaxID=162156 RepID=UPI0025CD7407|nr:hypothetical protein [uncultured Bacteroides sp.]
MDVKEHIILQYKSVLMVQFISNFAKLEKIIIRSFQDFISITEHRHKSKLYFMYGCTVGNEIFYDIDRECLSLNSVRKYDDNEMFKSLKLNKVIKFDKKEHVVSPLNINIASVQKTSLEFPFHDCILKFISMRNKLAHELDKINFKDSDIIETLSIETIKKFMYEWSEDWDFNRFDNDCILLYSNLIYLFVVLDTINKNLSE